MTGVVVGGLTEKSVIGVKANVLLRTVEIPIPLLIVRDPRQEFVNESAVCCDGVLADMSK